MSWINLDALWKIVVLGLVAGAGLPALFSIGLLALSRGPKTATAGAEALARGIGGTTGVIVDLVILIAVAGVIYWRSRGSKVDPNNVNAEWDGTGGVKAEPQPAAA